MMKEDNSSDNENDSMFFTTSDLLNTINRVIKETGPENADDNVDSMTPSNNTESRKSEGFELQRRMPDGSTRKADESDIALADFQSKMKQTADKIANFTPSEKLLWAKEQRQLGNKLYSKRKYKDAMDIYLTCLIAINVDKNAKKQNEDKEIKDDSDWIERTDKEIKLPVLMNLSACTLKLGMHRKTCSFCDMALEVQAGSSSPKIYFRRGKSYMLLGMYKKAEHDFKNCLEIIKANRVNVKIDEKVFDEETDAVKKEMETLNKLIDAAEKNRIRHKKAMKMMLGGEVFPSTTKFDIRNEIKESEEFHSANKSHSTETKESIEKPLYSNDYKTNTKIREFSTLRARKKRIVRKKDIKVNASGDDCELKRNLNQSSAYFIWYMRKVEFGLRKLLFWLGDEDAMTRTFDE